MREYLPEYIRGIISRIRNQGYEAHVAGGAVRDQLLGRPAKDFDLVTDARPEQVAEIAGACGWRTVQELGRNFGTVVLVVAGNAVEVATYRGEVSGQEPRSQQTFGKSLIEDLARRDFTINAMAMNLQGRVIDPFNGGKDLADKVIRTVGKAAERFAEDGLRMFRACRFTAELGFAVDHTVLEAISENLTLVNNLSLERVREEIKRTLLAPWPHLGLAVLVASGLAGTECSVKEYGQCRRVPVLPELHRLAGLTQNPRYHNWDVWEHTLRTVAATPQDYVLRWAALLHDAGKGLPGVRSRDEDGQPTDHGHERAGAIIAADVLERFQLPGKLRRRVAWLVARHMRFHAQDGENINTLTRWVRKEARSGEFRNSADLAQAFYQLGELCRADLLATGRFFQGNATFNWAERTAEMARKMPVHTTDVLYDPGELSAVLDGKAVLGVFLPDVLRRIQDGSVGNTREEVIEAARKWMRRHFAL